MPMRYDLDPTELADQELDQAFHSWFDLAQTTHDADPPDTHDVRVRYGVEIPLPRADRDR